MMKEFYQDILRRNPQSPTPFEKTVLQECALEANCAQLHPLRFRQMLEDISRRKAQAEQTDGRDWVVATFEGLLSNARKFGTPITEEAFRSLPSPEQLQRRIARRNRPAAEAYESLKAGNPCQYTEAERWLLSLYERVVGRLPGPDLSPDLSHGQALQELLEHPYRVIGQNHTGISHYSFYHKTRLLGTATQQVRPDFPLILCRDSLVFSSSFEPRGTVFPGMFRDIVDADDPTKPAARLTWTDYGVHTFALFWDNGPTTVRIFREDGIYRFYAENKCIAETVPFSKNQSLLDWNPYVGTRFFEDFSEETQLLLMCFPMLAIGL